MRAFHEQTTRQVSALGDEIDHWRKASPTDDEDKEVAKRERTSQEVQLRDLADTKKDLETLGRAIIFAIADSRRPDCPGAGDSIRNRMRWSVGSRLSVIQTQVRVYSIKLNRIL